MSLNFTDVNITIQGKPPVSQCQSVSYKHWRYMPIWWSDCCSSHGKLLSMKINNHTHYFIDWGPHGRFSHNCTEDNNTV